MREKIGFGVRFFVDYALLLASSLCLLTSALLHSSA